MLNRKSGHDTRGDILKRSRALFAQRGFEAVSMRDIADDVGIRPSSIYNHFPGKHALLGALMDAHMQRVLAEMTQALENVSDPADRLETFARQHLLIHLDYRDDVFLAYYEMRSLDGATKAHILSQRDAYEDLLRNILQAGAAAGVFQIGDSHVHGRAILAMLTGITVWYREGGALPRQAVIDTYMQAVMQGVGQNLQAPKDLKI